MEDTYKHKGLRRKLVETLRQKGITSEPVLDAIGKIPRHSFMDNAFLSFAYEDKAFPIAAGQTISQPYTVAFQSQLLDVRHGHKVLEIGTGSGYQTAVLLELKAKVFTVERQKTLYDAVKPNLKSMGFLPRCFYGDGYKGLPAFAPFDRILVTAGAPFVPDALKEQLKPNGILVIPVGDKEQEMLKIVKTESGFSTESHGIFKFVPMLGNRVWEQAISDRPRRFRPK